jgi:glyoxylase-like metal-dependent hydrolase (beta-lactamase superfamily II)
MSIELRIISIGTLAAHPLWGERAAQRTGHATTSLVRAPGRVILVDPGLPGPAIAARLAERSGIKPADVTDVFLTSFKPDTMRGIGAFEGADWWIHEAEREQVGVHLAQKLRDVAAVGDEELDAKLRATLEQDVAVLQKCRPAPDRLADGVALFPLTGLTPGMSGLLLESRWTTLICGDAVATVEHLERGQVLPGAFDVQAAQESFVEAVEIADLLVPGRDNLVVNPTKRPF